MVIINQICVALQPDESQPSRAGGNAQGISQRDNVSSIFKGADQNGDGYLGKEELQGFLRSRQRTPKGIVQRPVAYPVPVPNEYSRQNVKRTSNGVNSTVRMWNRTTAVSVPTTEVPVKTVPELQKQTATVPMGPTARGPTASRLQPVRSPVAHNRRLQPIGTLPEVPTAEPKPTGPPPPCACEKDSSTWRRPTRTTPSCFFFDFGAGDGETFRAFLGQSRKWQFNFNTAPFQPQDCFVYLMDPNPKYQSALKDITALLPTGRVMHVPGTAGYMCDLDDGTFYLDVNSPQGWGSSLDPEHESVKDTAAKSNVHVSLMNIMRLLEENTIPSDTVVVKLDIEGAEWDVLPCLANSSAASLIDTLYLESHCHTNRETKMKWCPSNGMADNSEEVFDAALSSIRMKGVDVPDYWSPLLF